MGWRPEKTLMKFIYRAFCPLVHFLIILSLPPSHSLVTDIRAAHSTLVLIKSNRNKPEPITRAARWADLGAEGIHLEGDGIRFFGVTMKSIIFMRDVLTSILANETYLSLNLLYILVKRFSPDLFDIWHKIWFTLHPQTALRWKNSVWLTHVKQPITIHFVFVWHLRKSWTIIGMQC